MALTTAELYQCKYLLGYTAISALARPYFDIALVFEDIIQKNLDTTFGEGYVRTTLLANLTQLDTDIMNCRTRFQASELVGDVKLNPRELESLLNLRVFWISELSRILGVPIANGPNSSGAMEVY